MVSLNPRVLDWKTNHSAKLERETDTCRCGGGIGLPFLVDGKEIYICRLCMPAFIKQLESDGSEWYCDWDATGPVEIMRSQRDEYGDKIRVQWRDVDLDEVALEVDR